MRTMREDIEQSLADRTGQPEIHPAVVLAVVGAGVLLGTFTVRRALRARAARAPMSATSPLPPLRRRSAKVAQLLDTWEHISDALLGVATAKAVDAIAERIPGFRDEFAKQTSRHGQDHGFDVEGGRRSTVRGRQADRTSDVWPGESFNDAGLNDS